jgi:hypothetical protein
VFEVFYGGARGGGKTEGSIGDWLEHCSKYGSDAIGVFFRRTAKQLEEVVARTRALFTPIGATLRSDKSEWTMPNGARLKFRYLERDIDAEEYQGHNYTRVYVEEVTNFPSPGPIDKLRATLRSSAGVPVGMRLTGNPGGPGHNWVKARYIDPAPGGYEIIKEKFHNPFTGKELELERVFIPSRLSDNPPLMNNDPFYVARLQQQGSKQLVRAWLEGDWTIILGAFFDCFDSYRHVLPVRVLEDIPLQAKRFRAFDWGSAKPFSVGWYVLSDGDWGFPKDAIIKYREWYGCSGPNLGLRMTAEMVAEGIKEYEQGEAIAYGAADPSIFIQDGGPSIAQRMAVKRVSWLAADRRRKVGWDQLRQLLLGEDGLPLLYFVESCEHTIRTLPTVQHDEHDPEDVDTDGEDHAADETRYAAMSRPLLKKATLDQSNVIRYPKLPSEMTINQLMKRRGDERRARESEFELEG